MKSISLLCTVYHSFFTTKASYRRQNFSSSRKHTEDRKPPIKTNNKIILPFSLFIENSHFRDIMLKFRKNDDVFKNKLLDFLYVSEQSICLFIVKNYQYTLSYQT